MLVFFPVWMIWGSTMADDMTLMNEHEIEALIGEYSGRKSDQWEQSRINKRICILDIYGNIIRQTEVSDDFPMKDPPILEAFLDKSMFLLEIEGIYYYLYEFSFQGKKNPWTGNFFNELFI
ncbi:MAG: hypothetical protein KFF73_01655 [Cyclobacteriaceae bacterium]|nr:hypothetical protein [Cyclobacteriaceae bacterium]